MQTAVAEGLDPYRYLTHVFETIPQLKTSKELEQLLIWNVVLPPRLEPVERECKRVHEATLNTLCRRGKYIVPAARHP